ncbi:1191_t:CDS:1, partial [Scutellospora calospora]
MRRMEFMRSTSGEEEEERTLGAYVAKVDVHFTIKKRDKLLEFGRNIMLDSIFDSLMITEDADEDSKEINDNSVENNSIENKLEVNQQINESKYGNERCKHSI